MHLAPLLRLHAPAAAAVLRGGRQVQGQMTLPKGRTSREIRSGRINRRPPSFAVTLVALAVVFALAWMFVVRSGPSASAPMVPGIQGTYTWEAVVPGASGVPRETGSFSAVASGDAGGRMTWENTAPRAGTSGSSMSAYDARAPSDDHGRREDHAAGRAQGAVAHRRRLAARVASGHAQPARLSGPGRDRAHGGRGRRRRRRHQAGQGRRARGVAGGDDAGAAGRSASSSTSRRASSPGAATTRPPSRRRSTGHRRRRRIAPPPWRSRRGLRCRRSAT